MVAGSTGYIGKYVTKELIKRGYNVVAFAREKSGVGGKQSTEQTQKVGSYERCLGCCCCPQEHTAWNSMPIRISSWQHCQDKASICIMLYNDAYTTIT